MITRIFCVGVLWRTHNSTRYNDIHSITKPPNPEAFMRRRESLLDSNYSFETRPEQFSIEEQPLPSYEYDRDCLIPRLKVFAKKFHIEMPRKQLNFVGSKVDGPKIGRSFQK